MTVKASQRHFDQAADGKLEVELVVVTYVGRRSSYQSTATRTQGYWPSYAGFQQGIPEVAFVPDKGLGYFESHQDFEVEYSAAAVAGALLDKNYLAEEVFSAGIGGPMRDRVLEHLEMERLPSTTEGIREELTKVAGLEEDPNGEDPLEFSAELCDPDEGYTRSELKEAARELRDGPEDIDLNAGKTDFAEYVASFATEGDMSERDVKDLVREVNDD